MLLHDRLFQAQGGRPGPGSKLPFQTVDVRPQRMESGQEAPDTAARQPQTSVGPHSVPNSAVTTVNNPYQRGMYMYIHVYS